MRVLLASGNDHKAAEISEILGSDFDVVMRDTGVEETGTTFEENALIKARELARDAGALALADDSGIEIDHLGGAPGVRSARWTSAGDWIPRVLAELRGVAPERRGCRYVCAAVAVWPNGRQVVLRGVVEGTVAEEARGDGGFGYDPLMIPTEGDGRTFAEMSPSEKMALSHRGRAFRQLAPRLWTPTSA